MRFVVVAFGTLVGPLDSAVNIAFPSITGAFGVPQSAIQWVVVCYVISYATLLLIFGRLGDLFGHLRVFQAGLAICALAFLGSGLADRFEMLLFTRGLQGIGTAMVLSCGPALTTSLFHDHQRTRALGAFAAVIGLGSAIGPSLGGILVEIWGWPAVFWFRLPIAVLTLVATLFLPMPQQVRADGRFDLPGAMCLAAGLGTLLIAISRLRYGALALTEILVLGSVLAAAAVLLLVRRREGGDAVVQFSMFRNLDLSLVTLTGIAVNLVGFAVMLFVPYFLSRMTALPVTMGGLVLAISPLGMMLAGQAGPRIAERFGAKPTAFAGVVLVAAGTGGVGLWAPNEAIAVMAATSLVHGLGLGLYQVAQLDVSVASLPRANRGVAGSLVMLSRTLGVIIAASLLTALFVALEGGGNSAGNDARFLGAFQQTFQLSGAGLAVFVALTCLLPRAWFAPVRT